MVHVVFSLFLTFAASHASRPKSSLGQKRTLIHVEFDLLLCRSSIRRLVQTLLGLRALLLLRRPEPPSLSPISVSAKVTYGGQGHVSRAKVTYIVASLLLFSAGAAPRQQRQQSSRNASRNWRLMAQ